MVWNICGEQCRYVDDLPQIICDGSHLVCIQQRTRLTFVAQDTLPLNNVIVEFILCEINHKSLQINN